MEEGQNHPIVRFTHLCHMIGEEFVFFSFWYVKFFELGAIVTFNNRSTVTHHKVDQFKSLLYSSCSERTDDAYVLLICFCFKSLSPPGTPHLSVDRLNSKNIYDLQSLIDCDPI